MQEERHRQGGMPTGSTTSAPHVVQPPPMLPCPAPFGSHAEGYSKGGGGGSGGGYASSAFQELLTLCDRDSRVLWRSPDLILSRVAVMVRDYPL